MPYNHRMSFQYWLNGMPRRHLQRMLQLTDSEIELLELCDPRFPEQQPNEMYELHKALKYIEKFYYELLTTYRRPFLDLPEMSDPFR
jgi:hypothetical protein